MISEAKKDVLAALDDSYNVIKNKQHFLLHSISDHILHVMYIYQDPDIIDVAIAIYALDKILEKEKFMYHPKMKEFVKDVLYFLKDAAHALSVNDFDKYKHEVTNLLGIIQSLTKKVKLYV